MAPETRKTQSAEYYAKIAALHDELETGEMVHAPDPRHWIGRDELLQSLIGKIPCCVLLMDVGGGILSVHRRFHNCFLGRQQGAVLSNVLLSHEHDQLTRIFQQIIKSGKDRVLKVETTDGELVVLRLSRNDDKVSCRVHCGLLDSALTRRIEKLRRLESASLVSAQIAHDLNNKLTVVIGNLSLMEFALEEGTDLGMDDESLAKASAASQEAKQLVSRLQTTIHEDDPDSESIELVGFISELVGEFEKSGCKCRIAEHGIRSNVRANPHELCIALAHVILNAWQACEDEPVQIDLIENDAENVVEFPSCLGHVISIRVTDCGDGLSEEQGKRVYQPYFTTKPGADGIGLTLTRTIVKRLDGHLLIGPNEPSGTAVQIMLPAVLTDEETELEPFEDAAAPAAPPTQALPQEKRVLVLDDDRNILEVTRDMLELQGFDVLTAEEPEQAEDVLRNYIQAGSSVPVAILDLVIHDEDGGINVLPKLRAIAPQIRAIACSGQASNPAMLEPEKYGFNGALGKPYTVSQLLGVIEKAMG